MSLRRVVHNLFNHNTTSFMSFVSLNKKLKTTYWSDCANLSKLFKLCKILRWDLNVM